MMYTEFFGLKQKPFNLTPSPRSVYLGEVHKEALSLLTYGVKERKGFVLLTGEVGTGKTTIVRTFLDNLDEGVRCVNVSNPTLSTLDFMSYIAFAAMGEKKLIGSKAEFLFRFELFLKRCHHYRQTFLLVIDEAHQLPYELMEEIRLLSNMETEEEKLINIFLVGQPELNVRLAEPECLPLLQRIAIRYHIAPLDLEGTIGYIIARLRVAGLDDANGLFSERAMGALFQYSGGYPRLINILADNALLLGYSKGELRISQDMIRESHKILMLPQDSPGKRSVRLGEVGEKGYSGENHWSSL